RARLRRRSRRHARAVGAGDQLRGLRQIRSGAIHRSPAPAWPHKTARWILSGLGGARRTYAAPLPWAGPAIASAARPAEHLARHGRVRLDDEPAGAHTPKADAPAAGPLRAGARAPEQPGRADAALGEGVIESRAVRRTCALSQVVTSVDRRMEGAGVLKFHLHETAGN